MRPVPEFTEWLEEITSWRHHLHAYPELAFEEHETAKFVAEKLRSFGLEVETGLAETGVVATLSAGTSSRRVGLRADLDALPIPEANDFAHCSKHQGKMHACGHDGHTVMLLAAAKYLCQNPEFDGTVHFIFQPAEEGAGGAKRMIEEGLFTRFPVDAVYGLHNFPGMPEGIMGIRPGALLAAYDEFDIEVTGQGGHSALPDKALNPIHACGSIIAKMTEKPGTTDDPGVLTVTELHSGDAYNVIPDVAKISGSMRSFGPASRARIIQGLEEAVKYGTDKYPDIKTSIDIRQVYPPTVNSVAETDIAVNVARQCVGKDRVNPNLDPLPGSEDFSFMLQERPGAYIFLGSGEGGNPCMLHNPHYDFNDRIIPVGASYWVRLVQTVLEVT